MWILWLKHYLVRHGKIPSFYFCLHLIENCANHKIVNRPIPYFFNVIFTNSCSSSCFCRSSSCSHSRSCCCCSFSRSSSYCCRCHCNIRSSRCRCCRRRRFDPRENAVRHCGPASEPGHERLDVSGWQAVPPNRSIDLVTKENDDVSIISEIECKKRWL